LIIRWLRTATRNRFEQLDYIAADNPAAAVRLDEAIERQTDLLAQHPLMGREGRVKGTRELVIGRSPFIAVYRVKKKRIEILRILHGAQQYPISPPSL
jgi:toxin ParE1/3/4